jgi:hypothetical protein
MTFKPDVDIEVKDRDSITTLLPHVAASQIAGNTLVKHNTGIYLQNIPVNPINGFSAFPYDIAEALNYQKIDLLQCPYPYNRITSMEHLQELLDSPIDWKWFRNVNFVSTLFHCGGTVNKKLSVADMIVFYEPKSITDIACLIAIKLPAKRDLIGESWNVIRERIWKKVDGIYFKKSHSIAYALVVGLDARLKAPKFFDK